MNCTEPHRRRQILLDWHRTIVTLLPLCPLAMSDEPSKSVTVQKVVSKVGDKIQYTQTSKVWKLSSCGANILYETYSNMDITLTLPKNTWREYCVCSNA